MPESVFAPEDSSDPRAKKEALKLAAGSDLEADGKKREHERHQKFRNHANTAILILFWLVVLSIAAGLITFTWHLVTPPCMHYLDAAALEKLQTILASALLSSALTGYAKQRLSP
jgi:hypothetical protein